MEGLCYAQEKSCVYLSSAAPGLAGACDGGSIDSEKAGFSYTK